MSSKLPINLEDLLRQRKVEGDRIEYKKGWNPVSNKLSLKYLDLSAKCYNLCDKDRL